MSAVIFNVILYISTLIVYFSRYKRLDIYSFILLLYGLTSILCANYYISNVNKYDLTFFPFIYLFVVLLIFIKPFKGLTFDIAKVHIADTKLIKALVGIYILSGAITIIYGLPKTMMIFVDGDFAALRNTLYVDSDSIVLYENNIERVAKNINSYLSTFGIIISFYQLTKTKIPVLYTVILFFSWVAPGFLASTLVASRGMIVFLLIKVAIAYLFFKGAIPVKRKRILMIAGLVIIGSLILYTMIVSESRFGDDANDSIKFYLGHSMLAFNDGLAGQIQEYSGGKYFFKWFIDFFGGDSSLDISSLGAKIGSSFITFIGCFYLDFGPIGTFILALIVSRLLIKVARKKTLKISDLSILIYFAIFFSQGVFVVGRGMSLSWVMAVVVYYILKFTEYKEQKQKKCNQLFQ